VVQAWGNPETSTYWRSAPKALQAIPFSEVAASLGLGQRHLALACASHSGEAVHLELARETLAAVGLDETALQCAHHPVMSKHSIKGSAGQQPVHNNCSGKHAAMLAVCHANHWPMDTYRDATHPLQQRILSLVSEATGAKEIATGIDGCGVPTFWLPVADLARTYQWLERHQVGRQCLDAMAAEAYLVAGRERFCTELINATKGAVIGKVGAAGVYVMIHRASGQAAAIKMVSGVAKAAEGVAASIAYSAGWLDAEASSALAPFLRRPITSCDGTELGLWQTAL
jgi:L-asparaginase II